MVRANVLTDLRTPSILAPMLECCVDSVIGVLMSLPESLRFLLRNGGQSQAAVSARALSCTSPESSGCFSGNPSAGMEVND